MKLLKFLAFGIICVLTLTACTQGAITQATTQDTANSEDTQGEITIAQDSSDIVMYSTRQDINESFANSTEYGYYKIEMKNFGSYNFIYTDYETAQRIYLCSTPNCRHNDETCTSYIPNMATGTLIPIEEDMYFLKRSMYEDSEGKLELLKMGLNGENQTLVATFENTQSLIGQVGADATSLYMILSTYKEPENDATIGITTYQLLKVNKQTGEITILKESETNYVLLGAYGRDLIFADIDHGASENYTLTELAQMEANGVEPNNQAQWNIFGLNVDTLAETDIFSFISNNLYPVIKESDIYFINSATSTMEKINLQTKETILIAENLKPETGISNIYDEYVLIYYTEDEQRVEAAINVETAEFTILSLGYPDSRGYEAPMLIKILAEFGDNFLVISGSEVQMQTLTNIDGSEQVMPIVVTKYSIISKRDYFANIPNYTQIKDLTL